MKLQKTDAVEVLSIGDETEEYSTHLPPFADGNYGTLCGVSTDDDLYSGKQVSDFVDCAACFRIWRHVTSLRVSETNFTASARREGR